MDQPPRFDPSGFKGKISVPTCVLLDLHMPILSEPDLVEEVAKTVTPRAPVHILLANSSE